MPGASEEDEHEGGEGEGGPLQGDQVEERGGEHGGHPAYTPGLHNILQSYDELLRMENATELLNVSQARSALVHVDGGGPPG